MLYLPHENQLAQAVSEERYSKMLVIARIAFDHGFGFVGFAVEGVIFSLGSRKLYAYEAEMVDELANLADEIVQHRNAVLVKVS